MKPAELDRLTKTFGVNTAVSELTLELTPGTITGFLGPNGAGKTTTLRMIGGLIRPTAGSVRLFGQDAREPQARARLGYMPADPTFLPRLSGRDNLDLLAALHGRGAPDRDAVITTLVLADADLDRPVGGYSSGMTQKLAIVASLQHAPELVVLDEPANRLDPIAHRAFCSLLRKTAANGNTVLLSSHVLAEVEAVCDRVVLLRDGRLLADAAVEDLRGLASRAVTLIYKQPPTSPPRQLESPAIDGTTVTGRIPAGRPDLVRELLVDDDVIDVLVSPASLEDVILGLYTGASR